MVDIHTICGFAERENQLFIAGLTEGASYWKTKG